jgi:hypothetical protein
VCVLEITGLVSDPGSSIADSVGARARVHVGNVWTIIYAAVPEPLACWPG